MAAQSNAKGKAKSAARGKHHQPHASALSMTGLAGVLALNLTNMAAVLASSGTVLLCLLIVKRF